MVRIHSPSSGQSVSHAGQPKLERRRILERTERGRTDAKAKGVKFGRKPTLTPHQQREARERIAAGETQRSVARSYNVSQATISRLTA
jgi:DNA invertase Pin-like site-specific DNA recombinase